MDILTAKLGANMAQNSLKANGQIGYTKFSAPIVLIPNGSYEFSSGELGFPVSQLPKAGDTITLTLDGVVYTATARELYVEEAGVTFLLIGNTVVFGGVDTGEPFTLLFNSEDGTSFALFFILAETGTESTTTHTVEVSIAAEIIHPIDPKYRPSIVVDMDDVIGAKLRNEEPATSLDDARIKAIVEGYKNRSLWFRYKGDATGSATLSVDEVFASPTAYGFNSYLDGSGSVYSFVWLTGNTSSKVLGQLAVVVYSDGSNAVNMFM